MTRRRALRPLLACAVCALAFLPWRSSSCAATALAECYLMDWELDTAVAPSPEKVRQWARQRGTHRSVRTDAELARLREILRLEGLKPRRPTTRDLRFVVDIRISGGRVESYYGDRFFLMSSDFTRSRRLKRSFQKEVSAFVGSRR